MNGVYVQGQFIRYTSRNGTNGQIYHNLEVLLDDDTPIVRLSLDPESVPDVMALKPMEPIRLRCRLYVRDNRVILGQASVVRVKEAAK